MKYNNLSIWDVAEIDKLEHLICARLALVTAEFSRGIADLGPMSKEVTKKLKNSNELLELYNIYQAIKEAKKCAQKVCDSWQAEESEMIGERNQKWWNRIDEATEKGNTRGILSAFADILIDLSKETIKPPENEVLYRSIQEMKKMSDEMKKHKFS